MDRIFWKNLLENKEMVFKYGVKNIQTASYDGAHTVYKTSPSSPFPVNEWQIPCERNLADRSSDKIAYLNRF